MSREMQPTRSSPRRFAVPSPGDIAQFVRLSIPLFSMTTFVHRNDEGKHTGAMFSSVDFNYDRETVNDFDEPSAEKPRAECEASFSLADKEEYCLIERDWQKQVLNRQCGNGGCGDAESSYIDEHIAGSEVKHEAKSR